MEETLDSNNVQLAQVVPKSGFSILSQSELQAVIDKIEPAAGEAGQGGPPATSEVAGTGIVPGTAQGGA
jgi:hypothetical protein